MPRRTVQGTVVSDAAEKTIVVKVERRVSDADKSGRGRQLRR
jgi:ribosomal protein S17